MAAPAAAAGEKNVIGRTAGGAACVYEPRIRRRSDVRRSSSSRRPRSKRIRKNEEEKTGGKKRHPTKRNETDSVQQPLNPSPDSTTAATQKKKRRDERLATRKPLGRRRCHRRMGARVTCTNRNLSRRNSVKASNSRVALFWLLVGQHRKKIRIQPTLSTLCAVEENLQHVGGKKKTFFF